MRSIKSECLDRMIFFGEEALRRAVREYLAHYHTERNHQGLDHAIIAPVPGSHEALRAGPLSGATGRDVALLPSPRRALYCRLSARM